MQKVWIDTDIAIGTGNLETGFADVDDAYAIAHLIKAPQIQLMGISTVFGNTDINQATLLAHEIVENFCPDQIPVCKGLGASLEISKVSATDAVLGMRDALRRNRMTIMAIGPASNLGNLLLLFPEIAVQIDAVVLVAGRRSPDQHFQVGPTHSPPFPDLNFDLDPDAFRILLQHDIPVHLLPFEISHKVWIFQEDLNRLSGMGKLGNWLARHSQAWLDQWKPYGVKGFNPFDVLASGYILNSQLFMWEDLSVKICIHADDTIQQDEFEPHAFKPYLIVSKENKSPRTVRYCHTPPGSFKNELFRLLGS